MNENINTTVFTVTTEDFLPVSLHGNLIAILIIFIVSFAYHDYF